ncbi:hypothetical protein N7520_003756 [Penicillium odoratum]|uniref:uncharacterized protein n=1 Tax=Penicillium odoratum TaxID=1167516 RepID=UPI002547408A|nr:uncharacterized protein N7520_003756 [Penicillium odoratum]KAJ5769197.1 hypothetical protein N7520_003756 [Penicillium odoratum]
MSSTPTLPPTMRAWVRPRRGPASSALELTTVFPTPAVPTDSSPDVLIRVSHVSLQFSTESMMKALPSLPFLGPWVPEIELSGEVVAAGEGAPAEVRGVGSVDMASASGIHGSGSTALKMIRTAGVREGHTVLVNGASGSVGSVLVQLCKLRGAKVVGVASGANGAMVRGLGVDEFIDYRKHDPLPAYLAHQYGENPFDFVLDCVGTQALFVNSPAYLKAEGVVINIGMLEGLFVTARNMLFNSWLPTWLGGVPRRYMTFSTPPARDDAVYLARLVEEGHLRVPVDSVFDMEDAISAYQCISTKRARGKVVVKVHGA